MKYVAQQIKFDLMENNPKVLEHFKVKRKDRKYQFFKERPLSVPLFTDPIVSQKIDYIHRNPIQPKWRWVKRPRRGGGGSVFGLRTIELNWEHHARQKKASATPQDGLRRRLTAFLHY